MAKILLEAHHSYVNKPLKDQQTLESPVDKLTKIVKTS